MKWPKQTRHSKWEAGRSNLHFVFNSCSRMNRSAEAVKVSLCSSSTCLCGHFVFPVTQLKEVVLKSGKVLRADVCVIGAGDVRDDVKCTFFHYPFSLLLTFEMSIFNLFFSHVSPLLQEVFLQQASWNRAASTWTPRASSLSTRYLTKPGSLSESVFVPFLLIHSSKLPPRWCRQMLMGSLPEEMWWSFLSRHATTRRWTSLTGKWLMYTVSVSQLDPQRLHI